MLQVRVVQALGPNYLGVFSPREAAVDVASSAAAAQPALTGRGALHTALAAAFAPLAHDSRSLVDFSPRGAFFSYLKKNRFSLPRCEFLRKGVHSWPPPFPPLSCALGHHRLSCIVVRTVLQRRS